MWHFSEDETYIKAECEKCGCVYKIPRETCYSKSSAIGFTPPCKCACGNISNIIKEKKKEEPKCIKATPASSSKSKENVIVNIIASILGVAGYTTILLLIALPIVYLVSYDGCEDDTDYRSSHRSRNSSSKYEKKYDEAKERDKQNAYNHLRSGGYSDKEAARTVDRLSNGAYGD